MRYNKIRKMDISNGPGVRVSIFMQGCAFHCPNCFNPETHDFSGGQPFDDDVIEKVLALANHEYIAGLSILGGEPMHPTNIEGTAKLAKAFKARYPDKTVWVWSGFLFEQIDKKYLADVDMLVDGQFVDAKKDYRLKFRGSSNQRVIDVQKSLAQGCVVVVDENEVK